MAGNKWDKQAEAEFPAGFDPEPTVFTGGLDRMVQLWEKARDANSGGYGGNRLFQVDDWPGTGSVTSCSPFTATICGMMFDADGGTDKKVWTPKYDNGTKQLPPLFYTMHNGNFVKNEEGKKVLTEASKARVRWFDQNKWFPPKGARGVNDSAHSLVWWGLGYEIDPRDMRRGDMVGIDWANNNGHATFCWDVHLDETGAVDCFLYLSSNNGPGVSIGTHPRTLVIQPSGKGFKKSETVFEDKEKYVTNGAWMCLPGKDVADIKGETFKAWPSIVGGKSNFGGYSIASLRVTRFWGFAPPATPHGNLLREAATAKQKTKWTQPEPYCTGTCEKPGRHKKASSKPVPKSTPEPKKAVTPAPVQQKKEEALPHQLWVEGALADLFHGKWIDKDPGRPDAIADSQSTAALKDFQEKFKLTPNGHTDANTRAALKKALADMNAGKPNPNDKAERKPTIEQFYWSPNSVEPGGTTIIGVKGENLDLVKAYEVSLTDKKSGASETVTLRIVSANGAGKEPLRIPTTFAAGATLTLGLSAGGIKKSSDVPLYVKKAAVVARDWLWDEKKWPASMTDQLKQLRLVQKQVDRSYTVRQITQYGVWDKITAGDTPVLDKNGRELGHIDKKCLYMADLEGTMRLDGRILNLIASGNVFDAAVGRAPFEKFNPKKSHWVDVTDRAPFGMGAKGPLIPFRSLAHNAAKERPIYGKKVYIQELDGLKLPTGEVHNGMCIVVDSGALAAGQQFDLFVGPESNRISLPAQCNVEILA